jgi:hypothetical protein
MRDAIYIAVLSLISCRGGLILNDKSASPIPESNRANATAVGCVSQHAAAQDELPAGAGGD